MSGSYRVDCENCYSTISAAARFCPDCGTEQQRAVKAIERMRSEIDHTSLLDSAEQVCDNLANDESLNSTARVECLLALRYVEAATSKTILSGHARESIVEADGHLFEADAEVDTETASTIRDARQLLWGAVDLWDRDNSKFVKRGSVWQCVDCLTTIVSAIPHRNCPTCDAREGQHVDQ